MKYCFLSLLPPLVIQEVLSHHLPGCHLLDCMLLLPDGVVGSPGEQMLVAAGFLSEMLAQSSRERV